MVVGFACVVFLSVLVNKYSDSDNGPGKPVRPVRVPSVVLLKRFTSGLTSPGSDRLGSFSLSGSDDNDGVVAVSSRMNGGRLRVATSLCGSRNS